MFWRVFLAFGALLLTAIWLPGALIVGRVEKHLLEQIEEGLRAKAILVWEAVRDRPPETRQLLQVRMRGLARETGTRITLIAEDGRVLADSDEDPVRNSLDAFVNLDARLARRVCRLDDEVDRFNREIIDELIQKMTAAPGQAEASISLFSATRHLERIADHATNIAEDVIYLVEGEIVRHRPAAVELEG